MEKINILLDSLKKYFATPDRMSNREKLTRLLAEDIFVPLGDADAEIGDILISFRDGEYFPRGFKDVEFERSNKATLYIQSDLSKSDDEIPRDAIIVTDNPIIIPDRVVYNGTKEGIEIVFNGGTSIQSLDEKGKIWPALQIIELNKQILNEMKS